MKNKSRFLLSLISIVGLTSCTNGSSQLIEPEMPIYSNTESFRIGNWGVPPRANSGYGIYENNPEYSTIENWQTMKNCGYNLVVPTEGLSLENNIHELTMADEVGIDILVRDRTVNGFEAIINYCQNKSLNYKQCFDYVCEKSEDIKSHINEYIKHKSFIGVNAYDEPSTDFYDAIAACQDWFYINYPEYEFYTNLLPVYATNKQLFGTESNKGYGYEEYVRRYAENVNPAMLSYDHYPILIDYDESLYIKEDFLYNLNVFAQQAKISKVPAYIYIQTMGFFSNAPITTYEEFAWQVYTSLAFGVKGILTFMYWTQLQEESLNNVRHGIVERDGSINEIYYEVQKVFNQIKDMEDVYMNFDWDGVKTFESGRIVNDQFDMIGKESQLPSLKDISKISNTEDVVVGQFKNKQSQYAYMVTNVASPWEKKECDVNMTLDNYDFAMVIEKGKRRMVQLNNHVLSLKINCGDGTFVVPVK